jgi:hypothetical protein
MGAYSSFVAIFRDPPRYMVPSEMGQRDFDGKREFVR